MNVTILHLLNIYFFQQTLELQSRISKWLRVTGYPNAPLAQKYGKEEVMSFLEHLQQDFTWEKLYDLSHPALPLIDDPAELALKITSRYSIDLLLMPVLRDKQVRFPE